MTRALALTALLALALGVACAEAHENESFVLDEWTWNASREVDLLVMMDDSICFAQEQSTFAQEIESLLRALTTGDVDGDGAVDTAAASSVHVGFVTSDMGTGGHDIPTCDLQPFGRDGILVTEGNTTIPGCAADYPPFVAFEPAHDLRVAADALGCVARRGTGGCGFEQPLDAVLKAVTPATAPTRFALDTRGHGDGANAGLVRERSLVAVLVLTDEEDTSAVDLALFDPMSTEYPGDLNLRGFEYPGALRPPTEYADGLLALRPGEPERVLFASLTGIPPELHGRTVAEVDAILADPRMQEAIDLESPTPRLVPSCNVPGLGIAFPARRIVTVGREIAARGGHTVAESSCGDDFGPQLERVALAIGDALRPHCLAAPLPPDARCRVEVDGVLVEDPTWIESPACTHLPPDAAIRDQSRVRVVCGR